MEIQADLSVCTFTHKPGPTLRRLLDSVYQAADPVSIEVIVVDLSQGTNTTILDDFPEVILYQSPGPDNFAQAHNRAMSLATGRYITLLEEDVVITPDCFTDTLTFLDDNPDVGIAAPKVCDAYGKPEPSCRLFFSPLSLLASYTALGRSKLGGHLKNRHIMANFQDNQLREIDWICGGMHIIRREVLEEIGFLDEEFTLPFSEQDYYLRARKAGWHNVYFPSGEVIHAKPGRYHLDFQDGCSFWQIFLNSTRYFKKKWLPYLRNAG